jgi:hypothetical protein
MLLNLNQNITITFYNVSPPEYSSLSSTTQAYFVNPSPINWFYSYSSGPPPTPTIFLFNGGYSQIRTYDSTIDKSIYLIDGRTEVNLTSVQIGTTCTTIGNNCFQDCSSNFSSVIFDASSSVTSFGDSSFRDCINLSSITIPNSVTLLDIYCFADCTGLTTITIPKSVTVIRDSCFLFCTELQQVIFDASSSIITLPYQCFTGCFKLVSINIPPSVSTISGSCFQSCSKLNNITIPSSVTFLGDSCFLVCISLTNIIIPSSVTSIGNNSFRICEQLRFVTFNNPQAITTNIVDMLTGIPNAQVSVTFNNTENYDDLNANVKNYFTLSPPLPVSGYTFIPISTTFTFSSGLQITTTSSNITSSIYTSAGGTPENLTSVSIGTSCTSIGDSCFTGCNNTNFTTIVIPDSVISLGNYCFRSCENINGTVTIPNSVTSLGIFCFAGCQSIDGINFESGSTITSLPSQCFYGCNNLNNIIIPGSVETIGNQCFQFCGDASFNTITIPSSVKTIGTRSFANCTNLTSVIFNNPNSITTNIPNDSDGILRDISNNVVVTFNGVNSWFDLNQFVTNYFPQDPASATLPNYPTTISYVFIPPIQTTFTFNSGFSSITTTSSSINSSLYLVDGRTVLNLISVVIGTSCTSIENNCFQNCSSLTSISIPNSVTSIPDTCFTACSSLNSISIPNSVTSLGIGCFIGCRYLTSISIPNSVTSIGSNCFQDCVALPSITFPNSITSIGRRMFRRCSSLTSVIFNNPSQITSIGITIFDQIPASRITITFYNTASYDNLNVTVKGYFSPPPSPYTPAQVAGYTFNPSPP